MEIAKINKTNIYTQLDRSFLRKYFQLLKNLSFNFETNDNIWFGTHQNNENKLTCKTIQDYIKLTNNDEVQIVLDHINYNNDLSFSLELQEESNNILFLDIDNHNNTSESKIMQVLLLLKQELNNKKNCNPFFIERNKQTGSVHLAFKFKNKISKQNKIAFVDYFKKKYSKYFERYKLNIEILHHCRIPLSIDYEFIRYNRNDCGKNYYKMYENNEKALDFYLEKYNNQNLPNHKLLHQKEKKLNSSVPEKSYYYSKFTESNEYSSNNYIDFNKYDLRMGEHKRHRNHITLGFLCLHNRMSYSEFEDYSARYNTGSRDLSRYFHKTCEYVWKFCQKEFVSYDNYKSNKSGSSNDKTFKNEIHLNKNKNDLYDKIFNQDEEKRLSELIDFIVEKEFKYKKTKKKKKEEFYVVVKELYCKQLYNDLNDKQMIRGYEFLKDCVSVGRYYLRKLGKALKIKNIEQIIKLIIKYVIGKIKRIKNDRYYVNLPDYHYAKHLFLMPISMVWHNFCAGKMNC